MKEILKKEKGTGEKTQLVEDMFDKISTSYDRLNMLMTFGMFHWWRSKALKILKKYKPKYVLDIATGTGDLAINIKDRIPGVEHILGVDISEGMMNVGRKKVEALELSDYIKFEKEDCTCLSYENDLFDAATLAYGIRNFEDIPKGLAEIYRVLKKGSPLIILELTEPTNKLLLWGYKIFAFKVVPFLGKLFSNNKEAYEYLPASISQSPQREDMITLIKNEGFTEAYYKSIFPGSCTVYVAIK